MPVTSKRDLNKLLYYFEIHENPFNYPFSIRSKAYGCLTYINTTNGLNACNVSRIRHVWNIKPWAAAEKSIGTDFSFLICQPNGNSVCAHKPIE